MIKKVREIETINIYSRVVSLRLVSLSKEKDTTDVQVRISGAIGGGDTSKVTKQVWKPKHVISSLP
jgi:hypothetical protein